MALLRFHSLRGKLLLVGLSLPALLIAVLFTLYYFQQRHTTVDGYVEKARAICLTAESTREEMDHKWEQGLFTTDMLRQWAAAGEKEKVMSAIPVVTAWRGAMNKAEQGGYQFRTPKFQPRNPGNEPDPVEAAALNFMKEHDVEEHYLIDEDLNAIRYFRSIKLTQSCLACHGDPASSQQLWGNDQGLDPTGSEMEGWAAGERHGAFEVIQPLDEADGKLFAALIQGGGVVLLGMGLLGGCFTVFSNRLTRPLKSAVASIEALAAGDLTQSFDEDATDEVGTLGASMNKLTHSFRGVLLQLRENSESLNRSSGSMSEVASSLADGSTRTSDRSNAAAAAGEQLAQSVSTMAATAEELSTSADSIAAAIQEMSASLNEVAKNCTDESQVAGEADEQARGASEIMNHLGDSAHEIGKVVELISKIAEQTNLLALNATIEASSAGEAGKGFAVVAGEVKELARQSAGASDQIRGQIEDMQASSRRAIQAIGSISEVIGKVNTIAHTIAAAVEEQSATINEIARTGSGVSAASSDLARNVEDSASGARSVSENIQSVNTTASETAHGAARICESAAELESMAGEFAKAIAHFKL